MFVGLCFDSLVWYYVKDLKIFDEEKGNGPLFDSWLKE
jgi:hypothetical protein